MEAYWVKFFKNAGFNNDVATRHAVIFSNNRIQPDMLPDLDKPSLKEMGITLMGDMIAILRYAKKVVEEDTCERFLVDTADSPRPRVPPLNKPIVKKANTKVAAKTMANPKTQAKPVPKISSKIQSVPVKPTVMKSTVPASARLVAKTVAKDKPTSILKRKLEIDSIEISSDTEDKWKANENQKRAKVLSNNDVGYTVIMPKGLPSFQTQSVLKKTIDPKRTVFDRLGDSSVTSTTDAMSTTFNITGLGKDVVKRNTNVFNRLGNKNLKTEEKANGNSHSTVLNKVSMSTSRITSLSNVKRVSTVRAEMKPGGTMRADFEKKQKGISEGVKQLMICNRIKTRNNTVMTAKQRLGTPKQVTFNKIATVARDRKPDVFSRLGM